MTRTELLALAADATPAPWFTVGPPWGDGTLIYAGDEDPHAGRFVADVAHPFEEQDEGRAVLADAEFIAAARSALPEALEALERAEREVTRLRAHMAAIADYARDPAHAGEDIAGMLIEALKERR